MPTAEYRGKKYPIVTFDEAQDDFDAHDSETTPLAMIQVEGGYIVVPAIFTDEIPKSRVQ